MTVADPAPEAGFVAGTRAPESSRDPWPGRLPLVWAPRASSVEVVLHPEDGPPERRPLRLVGAHEPGYWRADAELPVGAAYTFSVDGGPPVPDPCSTSLVDGLHGPSRVLTDGYPWTDDDWSGIELTRAVIMHLDVSRATPDGTLDAAAALLPQAAALGIEAVELAPVAQFDPALGPEAGVRLFAVHDEYGGPEALHRFVDAAHRAGLAVVMDLPHRWAVADRLGLHQFGPYASGSRIGPRRGARGLGDTPRLNLDGSGSRGPRDFLVAEAHRWLTVFHVDGLLLDIDVLVDRSAAPFLGELADEVRAVGVATGRQRTLLTDGRGMSDRLTSLFGDFFAGVVADPSMLITKLSEDAAYIGAPPRGAAPNLRRAYRATQRSGPVLVGQLTRLPAAARAVPWALQVALTDPDPEGDDRALMLATVLLAGTPVVLDTDHVPLGCPEPTSQRLRTWTQTLIALRSGVIADTTAEVDVTVQDGVLVVRRGGSALVLARTGQEQLVDVSLPLPATGGADATAWQVVAAWDPDRTELSGEKLRVPGRSAVVLAQTAVRDL